MSPNTDTRPPVAAGRYKSAPTIGRLLIRMGRTTAITTIVTVVPIFTLFANAEVKDFFDRQIGGCRFVLEKSMGNNGSVQVAGWISGAPLKRLPLMFAGRDASINTIVLDEPFLRDSVVDPSDLAFHPMTGMSCPGELCDGDEAERHQALVVLSDVRSEFTYRFSVRMKPYENAAALNPGNLKLYALFEQGLEGGACRVEPKRWFNFWVWADPVSKLIVFLSILAVSTFLLAWARSNEVK